MKAYGRFQLALILSLLHLLFCILTYNVKNGDGLEWLWVMMLDLPVVIIAQLITLEKIRIYFIIFFGTVYWFAIGYFLTYLIDHKLKFKNKLIRLIAYVVCLLTWMSINTVLMPLFSFLSNRAQRPAELSKLIDQQHGNYFTKGKLSFNTLDQEDIQNIQSLNCDNQDIIIARTNRHSYFLNHELKLIKTISMNNEYLPHAQWFHNNQKCYMLGGYQNLNLYDSNGTKLWTYPSENDKNTSSTQLLSVDGIAILNSNNHELNQTRFLLLSTYGGIKILNHDGQLNCSISELSMGTVRSYYDEQQQSTVALYSLSNNANGITHFKVIDQNCKLLKEFQYRTHSSEFDVVMENSKLSPQLILTDENLVSRVDLNSQLIQSYPAPGMRPYGKLIASLRLNEQQKYDLVLKKSLHPDLTTTWVFDHNSKIVFERVDKYFILPTAAFLHLSNQKYFFAIKDQVTDFAIAP